MRKKGQAHTCTHTCPTLSPLIGRELVPIDLTCDFARTPPGPGVGRGLPESSKGSVDEKCDLLRTEIAAIRGEAGNDNQSLEKQVNSALARLDTKIAALEEDIVFLKRLIRLEGLARRQARAPGDDSAG